MTKEELNSFRDDFKNNKPITIGGKEYAIKGFETRFTESGHFIVDYYVRPIAVAHLIKMEPKLI